MIMEKFKEWIIRKLLRLTPSGIEKKNGRGEEDKKLQLHNIKPE